MCIMVMVLEAGRGGESTSAIRSGVLDGEWRRSMVSAGVIEGLGEKVSILSGPASSQYKSDMILRASAVSTANKQTSRVVKDRRWRMVE